MPVIRIVVGVALLLTAMAPASAAEAWARACLTKDQQRDAVASGRAVPLAKARQGLKGPGRRDVIHARLCEGPGGLVYVLTLLPRSGKVTRVTIDALTGAVVRGH